MRSGLAVSVTAGGVAAEAAPSPIDVNQLTEEVKQTSAFLDDVFAQFAGGAIADEGNFRDIRRRRQTASRLG